MNRREFVRRLAVGAGLVATPAVMCALVKKDAGAPVVYRVGRSLGKTFTRADYEAALRQMFNDKRVTAMAPSTHAMADYARWQLARYSESIVFNTILPFRVISV